MTFALQLADLMLVTFLAVFFGVLGGLGGRWAITRQLRRADSILGEDIEGLRLLLRKGTGRAAVEQREEGRRAEKNAMAELRERALAGAAPQRQPRAPPRLLPNGEPDEATVQRAFSDEREQRRSVTVNE